MTQRIFVDANILFSRTLRDWLFLLKFENSNTMFVLLATEDVLAETMYRLRRQYPQWNGAQIAELRERLVASLDEVVDEYAIRDDFPGQDENDAHVHSAAVASAATMLLTGDRGFLDLEDAAGDLPYEVWSADDFFVLVDDSAPHIVERVTKKQVLYWSTNNPEGGRLVQKLEESGCPNFAGRINRHMRALAGPI